MGAVAARFAPSARDPKVVGGVELKSGETVAADIVVLGGGIVPAVGYLKGASRCSVRQRRSKGVGARRPSLFTHYLLLTTYSRRSAPLST